jgi:hypothetical protein
VVHDLALPQTGCRTHLQCLQNAMTQADANACDAAESVRGQMLDQAWNDCLTTACLNTKDTDFGASDCSSKDFAMCTTNTECPSMSCTQGSCDPTQICSTCISNGSAMGGACYAQAQACLNDT